MISLIWGIEASLDYWFNERAMSTLAVERKVRGLRRRPAEGESAPSDLAMLEAELVLLREENARLRVLQAREASPERALESARALSAHAASVSGDEGLRTVAEAAALRESLLAVCGEVEGALATVRERLTADADAPTGARSYGSPPAGGRHAAHSEFSSVSRLCALVAAAEPSLSRDRVEELHAYVEHLSMFAKDGVLPEAFHALAEEVFSDLVERSDGIRRR